MPPCANPQVLLRAIRASYADEYTEGIGKDRRILDKPPKLFHAPPELEVIDDAEEAQRNEGP